MTPMLLWLPLSPERATASLTRATLASAWPVGFGAANGAGRSSGSSVSRAGRAQGWRRPMKSMSSVQAVLSMRNENSRISGYTVGRPPTMPVSPGAMPVAAWAISRENTIRACLSGWRTASLITTSRLS
ncbi:hypothetical protein D3C75_1024430 [compost metagenome]